MSIISSMLGRKQSQKNGRTGGGEAEPVSVDILEPFIDAFSLAAFTSPAAAGVTSLGIPFSTASMDWKETETAHVFIADLPGLRKDDVKVEVEEEKVLKISGQRARPAEEKGDRWHRVERSSEKFVRTVRLPPTANTDSVQAALQNGVLTITIPKDNDRKASGRLITITN